MREMSGYQGVIGGSFESDPLIQLDEMLKRLIGRVEGVGIGIVFVCDEGHVPDVQYVLTYHSNLVELLSIFVRAGYLLAPLIETIN